MLKNCRFGWKQPSNMSQQLSSDSESSVLNKNIWETSTDKQIECWKFLVKQSNVVFSWRIPSLITRSLFSDSTLWMQEGSWRRALQQRPSKHTHGDPPKAEILFGRCKRQRAIFRRSLRGRDIYRLASQMFTSETSLYFSAGTTAHYQSYQNNPRAGADEL